MYPTPEFQARVDEALARVQLRDSVAGGIRSVPLDMIAQVVERDLLAQDVDIAYASDRDIERALIGVLQRHEPTHIFAASGVGHAAGGPLVATR